MTRMLAAGIIALFLLTLLIWQDQRWKMVDACHSRGGVWDGPTSKCRLVPARIFIGRELNRT